MCLDRCRENRLYLSNFVIVIVGFSILFCSSENFKPIDQLNPPSEHCGDSEDMESSSTTTKKSYSDASAHRKQPPASKVPPEAEIEEFFAAAEKREQKIFAEK